MVALSRNLSQALTSGDRKAIEASAGKMASLGSRTVAGALAIEIRGHAAAQAQTRVLTSDNLSKVLTIGIGFLIVAAIGVALVGGRVGAFLIGLPVIFALAWFGALPRRQRPVRRIGASNTSSLRLRLAC